MNNVIVMERAHKRFTGDYLLVDVFNFDNKKEAREICKKINDNNNSVYHYRLRVKKLK